MTSSALSLFALQDRIFGVCPCCGEAFRLSDCTLFKGASPKPSWLDRVERELAALDELESKVEERLEVLREAARRAGRKQARALVKRVDRIFSPKGLHADDAKPLCHPVDYVVFDGLNAQAEVSRIVLLDHAPTASNRREIQASIRRAIARGNVRWRELHVSDAAVVSERR